MKKDPFRFFKQDHTGYGIILGFLAPIVGCVIYYFIRFSDMPFRGFIDLVMAQRSLITVITSLSLLANAVLFTLYINAMKDRTAKGIFLSTVIYVIAALVFKLVL